MSHCLLTMESSSSIVIRNSYDKVRTVRDFDIFTFGKIVGGCWNSNESGFHLQSKCSVSLKNESNEH